MNQRKRGVASDMPRQVVSVFKGTTKRDLFLAAWDLASLCNDTGEADDDTSTELKLVEMINMRREQRKLPRIKVR